MKNLKQQVIDRTNINAKWNTNNGIVYMAGVVASMCVMEKPICIICHMSDTVSAISTSRLIDSLWVIQVHETFVASISFHLFYAKMKQMAEDTLRQIDIGAWWSFDCLFDMTVDFNSIFVLGVKCFDICWNRDWNRFLDSMYTVCYHMALVNMTKNSYINIYFSFYRWKQVTQSQETLKTPWNFLFQTWKLHNNNRKHWIINQ